MKSITKGDCLNIYNREKQFLMNAVTNGSEPYHFFSLSTINNNKPDSRMIVLRNVSLSPFKIFFNCDLRSPKAYQLKKQNNCKTLFYNQQRKIQIRLDCRIHLHYNNSLTKQVWEATPLQSRKCYMGKFNPSSKLKIWDPNIPIKYLERDPDQEESELGYKNFMHVELEIINTDILELHYNGHVRFNVSNANKIIFLAP